MHFYAKNMHISIYILLIFVYNSYIEMKHVTKMKISKEHYEKMQELVEPLKPKLVDYKQGLMIDPRVKDINRRFCFDILYTINMHKYYSYQEFDYNDEHLYTALKRILKDYI